MKSSRKAGHPGVKRNVLFLISVLAVFGAMFEILGGIWDGFTHLSTPIDSFWSVQHAAVYSGVLVIAASAVLAFVSIFLKVIDRRFALAAGLLVAGAAVQVGGGYWDSLSHELYGVDGVVSPSHLFTESGLIMSSIGGFLFLSGARDPRLNYVAPVSAMNIISSVFWVLSNFVLLLTPVVMCMPVHMLFHTTCAVM